MSNLTENAIKVLERRYLMKDDNGDLMEDADGLFRRVAHAVAQAEYNYISDQDSNPQATVQAIEDKFFNMMSNLEFLPNSPTLMNAGKKMSLSACFVLPVENDIREILRTVKNTAMIHKSGGGTGFNFSKVKSHSILPDNYRPRFAIIEDHPDVELLRNTIEFSHATTVFLDKESSLNMLINKNTINDKVLVIEDNMESIFDLEKLLDMPDIIVFSKLRPHKTRVKSTGGEASGPASFMEVWNEAIKFLTNDITPITTLKLLNICTEVVKQGGTRRGANMGILNIDNEFIKEFINCKKNNSDITNFNLSVGVTEGFWERYINNDYYNIYDYTNKNIIDYYDTSTIMNMIISSAHRNGEPGLIFLDEINAKNLVEEEIEATNPCGEQPLLPYESCNLGSINLTKVVKKVNNCDGVATLVIDYNKLTDIIYTSVQFLDDVIDVNTYPLPEIERQTKKYRKIGLGVMGLADLFCMLDIPYDSSRAIDFSKELSEFINTKSHEASKKLGEIRGSFPEIDKSKYAGKVMRNISTTTVAPTGTLSIIASVSSGIEPLFAIAFTKNVMDNDELSYVNPLFNEKLLIRTGLTESDEEYMRIMKKISEEGTLQRISEIPLSLKKLFVTAHDIKVEYHVIHQAAWQENIDSSISKTINLVNSASLIDVENAYKLAKKLGCKGITVYRDGSREDQVLTTSQSYKKEENVSMGEEISPTLESVADTIYTDPGIDPNDIVMSSETIDLDITKNIQPKVGKVVLTPRPRPEITTGFTEKFKIGCGNLYVTVNYDDDGICEVFTNTGKAGGCPSQSEATARLVSLALRAGVSVSDLIEQLKGIRCPSTIRQKGLKVTSCPDAIGRMIEKVYLGKITPAKMNIPEMEDCNERSAEFVNDMNGNLESCDNQCLVCKMKDFCNNPNRLDGMVHDRSMTSSDQITTAYEPFESVYINNIKYDRSDDKSTKYCPTCGQIVEHEGGCVICRNCGWGKCG